MRFANLLHRNDIGGLNEYLTSHDVNELSRGQVYYTGQFITIILNLQSNGFYEVQM